jgi:hypothetical protein
MSKPTASTRQTHDILVAAPTTAFGNRDHELFELEGLAGGG